MPDTAIANVAVIGAGTMGAQIASLAAWHGYRVALFDASADALQRGEVRARSEIIPAIAASSKFTGSPLEATLSLRTATSLEDATVGADLVIEAIREEVETKRTLFAELSALAPTAILATNSSSLPSSLLVDSVTDPTRLLNMHFFDLIWLRSMLELMSCGSTSDSTMSSAYEFGRSLGLVTAIVHGQSKGFIINRIWRAVKRESLRVVDEGVATPEDIDRLWLIFFQSGLAPFGIMDKVGLDVIADIEASYHAISPDPTDLPSPSLYALVAEGKLGEKTGEGFYSYPTPAYLDPDFLTGGSDTGKEG